MALTNEQAADHGFHEVAPGRFERVHAAGTHVLNSLEEIEAWLAQHAGISGSTVSRSDGASESRDDQERHSAQVGPTDLPTPAADAAAAPDPAPAAEPEGSSVSTLDAAVES